MVGVSFAFRIGGANRSREDLGHVTAAVVHRLELFSAVRLNFLESHCHIQVAHKIFYRFAQKLTDRGKPPPDGAKANFF